MSQFLHHYAADVTGVLSGFDRLRFRGTLRLIANARGLTSLMSHCGVLTKDFKAFALGVSEGVRTTVETVAATAGRPYLHHRSWRTDKEQVARALAATDHIDHGLIGVIAAVEQCQSFDLRSDKARGLLLVEPAVRKCLHYYLYYMHERFGFLHVRLQSWLPLNVWICMNGREWLARELSAAGVPFTRQANAIRPQDVARAQAGLDAQVTCDWASELPTLLGVANPQVDRLVGEFPLHYYWSLEESEWATDVLFRSPAALQALYPRFIRHGIEGLSCRDVMRYLGKRVNQDGSIPVRCADDVLSDLRPANVPAARGERRGAESVRLKHRVNRNWVKLYDKTADMMRVETVINDTRDLRVYRRLESEEPTAPKQWRRLRKGVVDVPRRAALSEQANRRYLDALAAVEPGTSLGTLAAGVCRSVVWRGRGARGLNPLSAGDAALLAAINRGEFAMTGMRNRELRACLCGPTPPDDAARRRQSAQVTRRIRLLRAHHLLKKIPGTHRYQVTARGRVMLTALLTARAANTRRLLEAA